MRAHNLRVFLFEKTAHSLRQCIQNRIPSRTCVRVLCVLGIIAGLLPGTAGFADSRTVADIDSRWLPWIGSWRLVSDEVDASDDKPGGAFVLRVSPGDDRNTVNMKTFRDGAILFDDSIVTDGLSQQLKEKECSGWYQYSWSQTGKRLFFESKSSCPGQPPQEISGLSIINKSGEWLDVQLLQRDEDRIITIRRYSPVPDDATDAEKPTNGRIRTARMSAATNFSIDEIVELSRRVAPEVLEAALVEYYEPFRMDSKTLVYLADSGVPSQIVDLMVALSYPEEFTVERHTLSITPRNDERDEDDLRYVYPSYGYYYIYDPWFPWHWTPYTYSLYWGGGWGLWPYYYPYYPSGVYRERRDSGRLIAGRGYISVNPRGSSKAKPRSAGSGSPVTAGSPRSRAVPNARVISTRGSSGSVVSPSSTGGRRIASPSSSSGSRTTVSSPSSSGRVISVPSGGGGRVSPSSGGGSSSASPGGYSGGGDSGGRRAKER